MATETKLLSEYSVRAAAEEEWRQRLSGTVLKAPSDLLRLQKQGRLVGGYGLRPLLQSRENLGLGGKVAGRRRTGSLL